jgi:hypothetical protein
MRPIQGKKYPGLSAKNDRSLENLVAKSSTPVQEAVEIQDQHEFRQYNGRSDLEKEISVLMAKLSPGPHSLWIKVGDRLVHKKTII